MSRILVLGDSHAGVFRRSEFASCDMDVVTVQGATISGFPNPNSMTQALPTFRAAIARTQATVVIVLIGEVDTAFIVWYRALKHGMTVEAATQEALDHYQDFLVSLISRFDQIVCISTPLPTIDDANSGMVAHLRREVHTPQSDRTALTLAFNEVMRAFCEAHGITYLALDEESLGEDGLVKRELLNENKRDHHYHQAAYAGMLHRRLVAAGIIT